MLFFFKQKTAYEMRISDWSSDVCSSDLRDRLVEQALGGGHRHQGRDLRAAARLAEDGDITGIAAEGRDVALDPSQRGDQVELPHIATEIGRAHVCTPVTNAHLVCRLLLEKNNTTTQATNKLIDNSK